MAGAPRPILHLPAALAAAIAAAAEAAYPEECCGLVLGTRQAEGEGWLVTRLVPAANRHAEPRRSFELDPATHFAVLRQLRVQGAATGVSAEVILGHYHSHPDSPAVPSERDRAQAYDPSLLWLIVAVEQGRAGQLAAWQVRPGRDGAEGFDPLVIVPSDEPHPGAKNA